MAVTESRLDNKLNGAHLTFVVYHVSRSISLRLLLSTAMEAIDGMIGIIFTSICVGVFLLLHKNPPYDVLSFGPLGNYSHTGTGPKWQSWLARKLNFTYYVSSLFLSIN